MPKAERKTLYTLNINYDERITQLTYPLLRRWAGRIGADFHIISDRKYPGWPVVYEKLQVHHLARKRRDDWSIFIDSDALVHPETPDFTLFLPRDTVAHNGSDMAAVRWDYDDYFRRDGRNIGSCTWMVFCSSWCLDLWQPLEGLTLAEALVRIHPTVNEASTVITKEHLIDDFTLSRNIARYGLKFISIIDLLPKIGLGGANFFFHVYTVPADEKVAQLTETVKQWKINLS